MLQFWNILYWRWKKTSDTTKVYRGKTRYPVTQSQVHACNQSIWKKGDQLCTEMKLIYTVHIQRPMRGMTHREQD